MKRIKHNENENNNKNNAHSNREICKLNSKKEKKFRRNGFMCVCVVVCLYLFIESPHMFTICSVATLDYQNICSNRKPTDA